MRNQIIKYYQEAVALAQVPDELKRSLKTNERIPAFIDNLHREFLKVPKVSQDTIRTCVYDMTNLMLNFTEKKAQEDYLSDAAKSALKAEADKAKRMNEMADEIINNDNAVIDAEELAEMADG